MGSTSAGAHHDIRVMPVELGLCDADCLVEVVVGEGGVQDLVAVVWEVGRLEAAGGRLPAVEEEDGHGIISYAERFNTQTQSSPIALGSLQRHSTCIAASKKPYRPSLLCEPDASLDRG